MRETRFTVELTPSEANRSFGWELLWKGRRRKHRDDDELGVTGPMIISLTKGGLADASSQLQVGDTLESVHDGEHEADLTLGRRQGKKNYARDLEAAKKLCTYTFMVVREERPDSFELELTPDENGSFGVMFAPPRAKLGENTTMISVSTLKALDQVLYVDTTTDPAQSTSAGKKESTSRRVIAAPPEKRTPAEKVCFGYQLRNANLLYLGSRVLVLMDLSYQSRFWTQVSYGRRTRDLLPMLLHLLTSRT